MIARVLFTIAMIAAPLVAAPVPKELKQKPDSERILGVWIVENGGTRWYFVGDKLFAGGTNTTDNKGIEYGIALRTNGAMREMDLSERGKVSHSYIFKFVDDDIHIAYYSGDRRPTDFAEAGINKDVLKRVSEAKK